MKKVIIGIVALIVSVALVSCGFFDKSDEKTEVVQISETNKRIVVGFSQLGAESDWRSANTESMKSTFTLENGYDFIFEDGQQKQSNQITAIRMFIQQEVDYIVLAPVTETGWDTVLREAKDVGIPVIIVDRMVDVEDESLFTCWVGSDFELEGKKVAEWLNQYAMKNGIASESLNIVNIQGTIGASAQIGRTKGLNESAAKYGWNILGEQTGDFTQAKGKEVMKSFLKQYDNINVVYCENDNQAFGAIEAIEEAGKKSGSDIANGEIMVLSFDGVNDDSMRYVLEDKITCIAECNPLHGPRVQSIIEQLENGETPEKFSYVDEQIYSACTQIQTLNIDEKVYPVIMVTPEMVISKEEEE